jgi:signal transduction histidine kinase
LISEIEPIEFKRVLSNLINNAAEAMCDQRKITLTVIEKSEKIEIQCADNGKGIPPEILKKLGQLGKTHGKEGGSGLGLYHAQNSVKKWGGQLKVESELNQGTSVIIGLLKALPPHWFVPELIVPEGSTVVVLDDDSSIHQIWTGRFEKLLRPYHEIVIK